MNKLKGIMREYNYSQKKLAEELGITVQALNAKLNGRSVFTVPEADRICKIFQIAKPEEIFFTKQIPNMQQK